MILVQATNLRDISWNTANQLLDTRYGNVAVRGIDNTAVVVDKLIDRYFPATEEETPIGKAVFLISCIYDILLKQLKFIQILNNALQKKSTHILNSNN